MLEMQLSPSSTTHFFNQFRAGIFFLNINTHKNMPCKTLRANREMLVYMSLFSLNCFRRHLLNPNVTGEIQVCTQRQLRASWAAS